MCLFMGWEGAKVCVLIPHRHVGKTENTLKRPWAGIKDTMLLLFKKCSALHTHSHTHVAFKNSKVLYVFARRCKQNLLKTGRVIPRSHHMCMTEAVHWSNPDLCWWDTLYTVVWVEKGLVPNCFCTCRNLQHTVTTQICYICYSLSVQ